MADGPPARQVMAPALDRQVKAGNRALESDLQKTTPRGSAEFDAVCGSHDDYIWQRVLGATPNPPTPAPAFSYSRYLTCDMAKEGEADMIMETALAPIMNKHVTAGHIKGWGWFTHNMGGTIRRILNWSGPDVISVLNAEEMISNDIAAHSLGSAFTAICNSHTDYVWRSEVASP